MSVQSDRVKDGFEALLPQSTQQTATAFHSLRSYLLRSTNSAGPAITTRPFVTLARVPE
jgi:hypothetical protein